MSVSSARPADASYDYTNPAIAPEALSVSISVFGGLLLVISAILFFAVLIRGHRTPLAKPAQYRLSVAVHQPARVPAAPTTASRCG